MSIQMFLPWPLDHQLAYNRTMRFESLKKGKIDHYVNGIHDLLIRYEYTAFKALLDAILNTKDVTGMRVYFACYPKNGDPDYDGTHVPNGHAGHITLLYVPTTHKGSNDLTDIETYYTFNGSGNKMITLTDKTQALRWARAYRNGIRTQLDPDTAGEDTNSIWYSKASVEYMNTDIPNHVLYQNSITVFFGAYDKNESTPADTEIGSGQTKSLPVSNQLAIIFGTGQDPLTAFAAKKKPSFWQLLKKLFAQTTDPEDYDTGAPCPPAEGCSGSSLYP